jgi:hypothetical protein
MSPTKRGAPGEGTPSTGGGSLGGGTIPTLDQSPSKKQAPVYVLRLQPLKGVDPLRALRHVLKRLLRAYGMKCLLAEESPADTGDAS